MQTIKVTEEEARILSKIFYGGEVYYEDFEIENALVQSGLLALKERDGGPERCFVPECVTVLTPAGRKALDNYYRFARRNARRNYNNAKEGN